MAKAAIDKIQLDTEVVELVKRLGTDYRAGDYIRKYSVDRQSGLPTMVTVQFIADEKFSKVVSDKEAK